MTSEKLNKAIGCKVFNPEFKIVVTKKEVKEFMIDDLVEFIDGIACPTPRLVGYMTEQMSKELGVK